MNTRQISVEAWHTLAGEGSTIPIRIGLDGDSMRPLIRRQRDKVTIVPLTRPPRPGDIVLFADSAGRYVVHRIWKTTDTYVVTLGDHCTKPDEPLRYDQIWGLITDVKRGHRTIPLDTPMARAYGKLWMALLPMRKRYYKMKNMRRRRKTTDG